MDEEQRTKFDLDGKDVSRIVLALFTADTPELRGNFIVNTLREIGSPTNPREWQAYEKLLGRIVGETVEVARSMRMVPELVPFFDEFLQHYAAVANE